VAVEAAAREAARVEAATAVTIAVAPAAMAVGTTRAAAALLVVMAAVRVLPVVLEPEVAAVRAALVRRAVGLVAPAAVGRCLSW